MDLGSGDGRIVSKIKIFEFFFFPPVKFFFFFFYCGHFFLTLKVLEAHQQGFSPAVGYELNPWLVRLARFHAWRAGHQKNVSYRREDLWKV